MAAAPFKVLLVPTTNPSLPNPGQATYQEQLENMSHSNFLSDVATPHMPSYADHNQTYHDAASLDGGQYDDYYEGASQYYDPATIEEIPPL